MLLGLWQKIQYIWNFFTSINKYEEKASENENRDEYYRKAEENNRRK